MKAKTVIILVICGALLLTVAAFAIFFARGGEVLFLGKIANGRGGGLIIADESVAEQIAKMNFTFSPTPNLNVHFEGIKYFDWGRARQGHETDSMVSCSIDVTGKALRTIPTGNEYFDISPEKCQQQLTREIQSRLSEEAEFQYTMDLFEWQTMPKKQ
jgi:hypothetical protein